MGHDTQVLPSWRAPTSGTPPSPAPATPTSNPR